MRLSPIAVAVAVLLGGCTPAPVPPAPVAPIIDLTAPGQAMDMIDQIMQVAGSTRVINLSLTKTEAHLTFAVGSEAVTYAYRDEDITQVDSDITYVGQTIFDPRDFAIRDLGVLFNRARLATGSDTDQRLQIVEYNSGQVYMNVTTIPETFPVFFTSTGRLLTRFDPTQSGDLAPVLSEILEGADEIVRLAVSSTDGVWVELSAGEDQVWRSVRTPGFPPRGNLRPQSEVPEPFEPLLVDANRIVALLDHGATHLNQSLQDDYELVISIESEDVTPTARMTIGTQSVHMTLTGEVIP